ncbi:hypothetical protein T484DRAFT_1906556 [Baffinella frigidus]|nr:hypothetical protein T484DRAFT_1906556 [Cryptophyta sp. CCMP2293]|mmetsp:Transcript_43361/g.102054  ORF Transcript_43361/g.102054 Transcript_43361/m.102054 type:complete len:156 (-) Transcript_43361:294-761(-)
MELEPAHAPAALAFLYDMLGDAAVFDRNYEEDAIESSSSLSSEARFTRSGRVPLTIQAILQGRVKRSQSDGERSAASTHGNNTPTTIPGKNGEAWLDRADQRERFNSASPQNSPINAVPKNVAARADFTASIVAVQEVTKAQEPQDEMRREEIRS